MLYISLDDDCEGVEKEADITPDQATSWKLP